MACLLAGELSFFVKNNKRLKLFWEISKIKSKFLFKFIKYFNYFNYFTQVRFIEVGAFQGGQDGEKKRRNILSGPVLKEGKSLVF